MVSLRVIVDLPFYLRLAKPIKVSYDDVCQEAPLTELSGESVDISFAEIPSGRIDKSGMESAHSQVILEMSLPALLADKAIGTFAINNCREVLNRLILSYQAASGEVSNAGFIHPLGTSDMQFFADIRVDGEDVRDRWPFHSFTNMPLSPDQRDRFDLFLTGKERLPLPTLFLTNATLLLETGQYSLSVVQAASAVELRLTEYIVGKLAAAAWSATKLHSYTDKTLGAKLGLGRMPLDEKESLPTYLEPQPWFPQLFSQLKDPLNRVRNHIMHDGHLATQNEALQAVQIAVRFLRRVR